jgi:hypothetical protein
MPKRLSSKADRPQAMPESEGPFAVLHRNPTRPATDQLQRLDAETLRRILPAERGSWTRARSKVAALAHLSA